MTRIPYVFSVSQTGQYETKCAHGFSGICSLDGLPVGCNFLFVGSVDGIKCLKFSVLYLLMWTSSNLSVVLY